MSLEYSTCALNIFHFFIFIIGLVPVIWMSNIARKKKLINEKYWIAIIAFIAFAMYCVVDYDPNEAKFRHPSPRMPCSAPAQNNGKTVDEK